MDTVDFGYSVFICSKPLQVLNCLSIAREFSLDCEIHVVTHGFSDHEDFSQFIRSTKYKNVVRSFTFHPNYNAAVSYISRLKYESVFVEDDRTSLYFLFLPLKRRYFCVFEEGFGTYMGNYPDKLKGVRFLKWKMLALFKGCGIQFGESRQTDFVFVQYPELYKKLSPNNKKIIFRFPGLIDEIEKDFGSWSTFALEDKNLFDNRCQEIAFVLGPWGGVSEAQLESISGSFDKVFYKAHPHDGKGIKYNGVKLLKRAWIPAEVFISVLSGRCDKLTVFHFSSSAAFYAEHKHSNVKFVDLCNDHRFLRIVNLRNELELR